MILYAVKVDEETPYGQRWISVCEEFRDDAGAHAVTAYGKVDRLLTRHRAVALAFVRCIRAEGRRAVLVRVQT